MDEPRKSLLINHNKILGCCSYSFVYVYYQGCHVHPSLPIMSHLMALITAFLWLPYITKHHIHRCINLFSVHTDPRSEPINAGADSNILKTIRRWSYLFWKNTTSVKEASFCLEIVSIRQNPLVSCDVTKIGVRIHHTDYITLFGSIFILFELFQLWVSENVT